MKDESRKRMSADVRQATDRRQPGDDLAVGVALADQVDRHVLSGLSI